MAIALLGCQRRGCPPDALGSSLSFPPGQEALSEAPGVRAQGHRLTVVVQEPTGLSSNPSPTSGWWAFG